MAKTTAAEQDSAGAPSPRYHIERPARLGSAVVSVLIDRIAGGEFPAGSVLPPEPELAAEFGVSRTVMREALKGIEERGLARIQQGKGTSVLGVESWDVLDDQVLGALLGHDTGFSVLGDLVDVRAALESAMAALAAQRITDEQLRELRSTIVLMDEAYEHPTDYRRIEQGFHCLIMEASGNVVGRAIITSIVRHMQFGDHPWTHAMPRSVNLGVAHAGHHEIHRQIARRDPTGTARAMRAHIRTCWSWVPARP